MEVSEILCIVMELGPKSQQVNGVATAVVASCDICGSNVQQLREVEWD